MKRYIVSCAAAAVLAFGSCGGAFPAMFGSNFSASAKDAEKGTLGDLTWTLSDSGTLTVRGTGEMLSDEHNSNPFRENANIKSVIIKDGVTGIGNYMFCNCSALTSVTIPSSVKKFGELAFEGTPWLKAKRNENPFVVVNGILIDGKVCAGEVKIPSNVKEIAPYAFYGASKMTALTIPNNVTFISGNAFRQCTALTSVTLPNSITTISNGTFVSCNKLSEITIPNSVTRIEHSAFEFCDSLAVINIPSSVEYIGDAAFAYCDSLTDVTIPEGVLSIGRWAFSYCDNLASVTIPMSAAEIGRPAFNSESDVTLKGYIGTEAKKHADIYRIKFESLGYGKGDLNGDGKVNDTDATSVLKEFARTIVLEETSTLSADQAKAADVDGNGEIDTADATFILRFFAETMLYDKANWDTILST